MKKSFVTTLLISTALSTLAEYPIDYAADTNAPNWRAELKRKYWHDASEEIRLWPEGKIPFHIHDAAHRLTDNELERSTLIVTDVNDPFYVYRRAPGDGVHPCVVVCPGGGYYVLAWNKEGEEIAEWLNGLGFDAAVLAYRVSGQDQRDGALSDAQRTIRLLRRDAAKLRIDPSRLGIIGFSAGANLAFRAGTNWERPIYAKVDDADDFSCRPDFMMPIYPWDVRTRTKVRSDGRPLEWKRTELDLARYPVSSVTPPCFTAQTLDDACDPWTATAIDFAMKRVGADCTLKLYQSGGHGYGLRMYGNLSDLWVFEATSWLARFVRTR